MKTTRDNATIACNTIMEALPEDDHQAHTHLAALKVMIATLIDVVEATSVRTSPDTLSSGLNARRLHPEAVVGRPIIGPKATDLNEPKEDGPDDDDDEDSPESRGATQFTKVRQMSRQTTGAED